MKAILFRTAGVVFLVSVLHFLQQSILCIRIARGQELLATRFVPKNHEKGRWEYPDPC